MKSESKFAANKLMIASAMIFAMIVAASAAGQAATFKVVYTFTGGADGGRPLDGFVADSAGNLYATAFFGGTSHDGVVFKVTPGGAESVLHSFEGDADGANPEGGLILYNGNLYGTTTAGGAAHVGTVFIISTTGEESVFYSFRGGKDGSKPESALAVDASGNLYGTTTAGGASNKGTVFKLSVPKSGGKWTESVLHSFGAGGDGAVPVAGVTYSSGKLYGTTSAGGAKGDGTVFELTLSGSTWKETILHAFENGDDGATPYAGLVADKAGNFYGAATDGGTGGGGTVFKLTPSGGSWSFDVIYSNPGWGISGSFRNLLIEASGTIYGTTHCDGEHDAGTVYELTPSGGTWKFTQLYQFTGGTDGLFSFTNPVLVNGKIYGTTNVGGSDKSGVVWEVTP